MPNRLIKRWDYTLLAVLALALIVVSFYYHYGNGWGTVFFVVSAFLLLYTAAIDFVYQEVDWRLLALGLVSGLASSWYSNGLTWFLLMAVIGSALIPLILVSVSREKWMGWGDVIIAGWVGSLCGYPNSLIAIFFAFLLGALSGIIDSAKGKNSQMAFGPFLLIGGLFALLFADKIILWYFRLS